MLPSPSVTGSSGGASNRPSRVPKTLKASDRPDLSSEVMRRVKAPYRPVLVVLAGNEVGRRVTVDRTILVGRDPEAELTLTDGLVSWHHARIEDLGDAWGLADLGSTNGTLVNGDRKNECALAPNDRLVFGSTVVSFELQDGVAQAYNEVVERLLNVDDLSGLYVRRKFDAELALLLEQARLQSQPLALLVMDLDGVKAINDKHGHLFGAYTIAEAGRLIGRVLGERGIAARFGGDEYLAALPEAGLEQGAALGEELRAAIAQHEFVKDGIVLKPGISVGVAAFPESAGDAATLFQRADEALYRAKQAGKNRVCR
jgi:two-component system, cell cycle response regulator